MSPSLRASEPSAGLGRLQPLGLNKAAPEPIPQNWPARPGALLLVCGGRDYADSAHVFGVLDALRPRAVVHGACGVDADRPRWGGLRGGDRLADAWCARRQVPVIRVPARWSALGRRAGAVRNQQMLELYHPALVVAFPGHLGTADLVRRARAVGVPVRKPAAPQPGAPPRWAGRPGGMKA
ncbi:MAG TPA: SLOG family protein [Pseudomonadota bacterium]|nr:SLOG family protein [Pseudomonadota bacterium]